MEEHGGDVQVRSHIHSSQAKKNASASMKKCFLFEFKLNVPMAEGPWHEPRVKL